MEVGRDEMEGGLDLGREEWRVDETVCGGVMDSIRVESWVGERVGMGRQVDHGGVKRGG